MKQNDMIEFDWSPPSEEEMVDFMDTNLGREMAAQYRSAVESSQRLVESIEEGSFKPHVTDCLYILVAELEKLCSGYNPKDGFSDWLVNLSQLVEVCVDSLTEESIQQGDYVSLSGLLESCPIYTNNKNYESNEIDFEIVKADFNELKQQEWYVDVGYIFKIRDMVNNTYTELQVKPKKTIN